MRRLELRPLVPEEGLLRMILEFRAKNRNFFRFDSFKITLGRPILVSKKTKPKKAVPLIFSKTATNTCVIIHSYMVWWNNLRTKCKRKLEEYHQVKSMQLFPDCELDLDERWLFGNCINKDGINFYLVILSLHLTLSDAKPFTSLFAKLIFSEVSSFWRTQFSLSLFASSNFSFNCCKVSSRA